MSSAQTVIECKVCGATVAVGSDCLYSTEQNRLWGNLEAWKNDHGCWYAEGVTPQDLEMGR